MNCYQVVSYRPSISINPGTPDRRRRCEAFYVADHIAHVIARLENDLKDEGVRIESVIEVGPIVALLDENGQARSIS